MKRQITKSAFSPPETAAWMTTYADLVTLLLCFFVLLYSFSALDVERFRKFVASFQGQGILTGGTVPVTQDPSSSHVVEGDSADADGPFWSDSGRMLIHVQEFLQDNGIEGDVRAYEEQGGVLIELKDHLLFDSARADIRSDGRLLLDKLAQLLNEMPNSVAVEGHTDNIPIRTTEFPTNWELSGARAARVVRYFIEVKNMDARRFAATGFGEFHPLASNSTAFGRSQNRRVVFFIKEF